MPLDDAKLVRRAFACTVNDVILAGVAGGVRRLMESDFAGPVNIGSQEMVSINQLARDLDDLEREVRSQ